MGTKTKEMVWLFIVWGTVLYVLFAGLIFQLNNPTANKVQVFAHPKAVFTFEKLDKFQGK